MWGATIVEYQFALVECATVECVAVKIDALVIEGLTLINHRRMTREVGQ
jgi:hypothetical protein